MILYFIISLRFINVKEMEVGVFYSNNYVYKIKPEWTKNAQIKRMEIFDEKNKLWETDANYESGAYISPYGDMVIGIRKDKIFVYTKEGKKYSIPIKRFISGHFDDSIFVLKDVNRVIVINKDDFYEIKGIKDIFISYDYKVKLKEKRLVINNKEIPLPEIYLRRVKVSSKYIGLIFPHNLYIYSKEGNLILKKRFDGKLTSLEVTDNIIFVGERSKVGAKLFAINYNGDIIDSINFTEKYSQISFISYWADTLRFVNNRKIYKYVME